jgi:hypothetical protein
VNRELSPEKHQQRLDCHKKGMTDKESAIECGIATTTYRDWRCKHRIIGNLSKRDYQFSDNGRPKNNEHYEEINKEMPPIYSAPCKSLTLDIQEIEEYLKKEYGNKIGDIKMSLSERARVWNMNGVVIGSSYYMRRL